MFELEVLITYIQGWRGSGGKKGIVVLDNINITQVNLTTVQLQTINNPQLETNNEFSKEDCLHPKVELYSL